MFLRASAFRVRVRGFVGGACSAIVFGPALATLFGDGFCGGVFCGGVLSAAIFRATVAAFLLPPALEIPCVDPPLP